MLYELGTPLRAPRERAVVPPTTLIRGAPPAADLGDAELLERVRGGDRAAYGVLFERHEPAARALARQLSRSATESDDLVADAFARVLQALDRGAGPTEAFRPYLLTTVRRQWWRRARVTSTEEGTDDPEHDGHPELAVDAAPDRTDEALAAQAFSSLPERWQLVLWHSEVEGASPPEIAKLLEISPNAAAALAHRAREGLRQAFLQAHLQHTPKGPCRHVAERLGAFTRDGLGKRDKTKIEEHLANCERCSQLESEVRDINGTLRSLVAPGLLGVGLTDYLGELRSSGGGSGTNASAATSRAGRAALAAVAVASLAVAALGIDRAVDSGPGSDSGGTSAGETATGAALGGTVVTTSSTPAGSTESDAAGSCQAAAPLDLPSGAHVVWAQLTTAGGDLAPGGVLTSLATLPVENVTTAVGSVTGGVAPGLITDSGICTSALTGSPALAGTTGLLLAYVSPSGPGLALVPAVADQVDRVAADALVLSGALADWLLGGGASPPPPVVADPTTPSTDAATSGGEAVSAGAAGSTGTVTGPVTETLDQALDQTLQDTTGVVDDVLGGLPLP